MSGRPGLAPSLSNATLLRGAGKRPVWIGRPRRNWPMILACSLGPLAGALIGAAAALCWG